MAPRSSPSRGEPLTYVPAPPPAPGSAPEEIVRATWDELQRLATLLGNPAPEPAPVPPVPLVGASAYGGDTINVAATATYSALFDNSPQMTYNQPANSFNPATAFYTVPADGVYSFIGVMYVNPLTGPATITTAHMRLGVFPTTGGNPTYTFQGAGNDSAPITVTVNLMLALKAGDLLAWYGGVVHPSKTGTVPVTCSMTIRREGN